MPANNRDYWERKIDRNVERDKKVKRELRKAGWTVVRVWEHELKDGMVSRKLKRIAEAV